MEDIFIFVIGVLFGRFPLKSDLIKKMDEAITQIIVLLVHCNNLHRSGNIHDTQHLSCRKRTCPLSTARVSAPLIMCHMSALDLPTWSNCSIFLDSY